MTNNDFDEGESAPVSTRSGGLREFTAVAKWPLLAMTPGRKAIEYIGFEHGKRFRLRVDADDPALGVATLHDGNVLVWIATKLAERLNAGHPLHEPLSASPNEMLRALGQPTGGAQSKALRAAVHRLANTAVATDLAPQGERRFSPFNLIERLELPPIGERGAWRITPPSWFIEQLQHRQILKLEPSALRLRGLESRIAAWGRAHTGGRGFETYHLSFKSAHRKAGSADTLRRFRHALRGLIGTNAIRGFALSLDHDDHGDVLMIQRLAQNVDPDPLVNAGITISLGLGSTEARAEPEVIDLLYL